MALFAAGFSVGGYESQALKLVTLGPMALFLFMAFAGYASVAEPSWGYGFAVVGLVCVGVAMRKDKS